MPLSLIYSDSFQHNEDLCNVLAALQFRGFSTSDPRGVVAQAAGGDTRCSSEGSAGKTSPALGIKPSPPTFDPLASYRSRSLGDPTGVRDTRAHAGDAPQGSQSSQSTESEGSTQFEAESPQSEDDSTQVEAESTQVEAEAPPRPHAHFHHHDVHSFPHPAAPRYIQPDPEVFRRERRERRARCEAYVVFEGLAPGIYGSWKEVEPLVSGVSGNVHQGFVHRCEAERAYVLAFAMGALRALPGRHDIGRQAPAPAMPMPDALMDAFASASDDFLGAEWHVVFKGLRPGVYPAWNFAATQTKGISNAMFSKFPTKADAEDAYREAVRDGFVEVLHDASLI